MFKKKTKPEQDVYQFGKSTMPDQLDQTWVNCLNPFDAEYSVLRLKQFCR